MSKHGNSGANWKKNAQDMGRVAIELVKLAFKIAELLVVFIGLIHMVRGWSYDRE